MVGIFSFAVQEFHVGLQAALLCMEHLRHAVAGERGTRHGVYLRTGVGDFLLHGEGYPPVVAAGEEVLALELRLPCGVVLDFRTQAGVSLSWLK